MWIWSKFDSCPILNDFQNTIPFRTLEYSCLNIRVWFLDELCSNDKELCIYLLCSMSVFM